MNVASAQYAPVEVPVSVYKRFSSKLSGDEYDDVESPNIIQLKAKNFTTVIREATNE